MSRKTRRKEPEVKDDKSQLKRVSVSISFKKSEVTFRKQGPYTGVIIKRGITLDEPGQPALPWRKFYVSVPWDAIPKKLIVKSVKTEPLADEITVSPCQPNVPTILGSKVTWVKPNRKLYNSEVVWPKVFARFTMVRRMGGFALAEMEICPFRYHLRAKKLDLIRRLRIVLTYTQTGQRLEKPRSIMALRHERKFMQRAQKMVLNPEDVGLYKVIEGLESITDTSVYPEIDYVIITSSALSSKFERLAQWRALLGLRARVVTVEDIVAGTVPDTGGTTFWHTTGYVDGGTRDVAETIRNFIKWISVNWLTDYVLLGGDTEIIPCRQGLHSAVGSVSYGDIDTPDTSRQLGAIPTASSVETGTSIDNVLDDDVTTVWRCASDDTDPWIRVSVGTGTPVNHVKLTWGTAHATAYTVQVSDDGTTWTDVYTTSSGSGGTEAIGFSCVSANYVRLRITAGTNFSLASLQVYGPHRTKWGGKAYPVSGTVTRIYLGTNVWMSANPTNSLDENLILIKDGPQVGTIVPYDVSSNDTTLGWHFVEDLAEMPGTVSTTATRYIEVCGPAQYHGQSFVLKRDYNYIPADLYYSDIAAAEYPPSNQHDWDTNGNGVYGEQIGGLLDGVNGLADVYLGRAPVETVQELDDFIDKCIHYERFVYEDEFGFEFQLPMDFSVSVLLGAQNWGGDNPGHLDGAAVGKEDIRRAFLAYDSARWFFTRRYQDHADVPTADQAADLGAASKTEILNAIRDGSNVVSLSSHGNSGYLCYLITDDIDDVVSHSSIFYGNACSTNKFDVSFGEAFSEWTILNENGAAVAYVGNSRFGWTGDNPIELGFWEEMLDSGILGKMFDVCKQLWIGWQSYSINLLGDPAMRVWSDRPKQLNVTHPSEVCTGSSTFKVRVSSDGSPVENALVCATMPGTMLVTGLTNTSGIATLSIAPSLTGTMKVTVSGKNLIPYFGGVTVKECRDRCIVAILCGLNIICGTSLACARALACKQALICTRLVECGKSVTCGKAVLCTKDIAQCLMKLGCGQAIGACPTIRPEFRGVFEGIHEIWGFRDLDEFVKRADTPEIKTVLDQLPAEVAKPIRMMIDRIRKERHHGGLLDQPKQ